MKKIWTGRISKKTDKAVEDFTTSINVDGSLYLYDIIGTAVHVIGLNRVGIIKNNELEKIIYGLKEIKNKVEESKIKINNQYEDIHSLVENELEKIIGKLAGKVHAGRSRNDQIVLDERLFLKDALIDILGKILILLGNIINLAEKNMGIIIPAYTHLQKAQPVLLSHYLLSYFEKFRRDAERLFENFESCDTLPLGAAACTGSGYEIDRELVKKLLKFKNVSSNSMDDVSSRDFILDFIYGCSMIMLHLSRFCEDLIIYNTSEFSFIDIDEAFCTGSSIMPQKKNPDVLELVRGKSSLVIGSLMQLMMLMKGLPSTYNRDMQEDKKILFSAYEETCSSVDIFSKLLLRIKFNYEAIERDLRYGFLEATDIADYLVKKGEGFRKSHYIVGKMVKYCIENNLQIKDLALEELKKYSPYFDNDIYEKLELRSCINSKNVNCGTNLNQVKSRIKQNKDIIKSFSSMIDDLEKRIVYFDQIIRYVKDWLKI